MLGHVTGEVFEQQTRLRAFRNVRVSHRIHLLALAWHLHRAHEVVADFSQSLRVARTVGHAVRSEDRLVIGSPIKHPEHPPGAFK